MYQTSSDPSPSNPRSSKSKSKKPRKRDGSSKSKSKKPRKRGDPSSSTKQVPSDARNQQVKTKEVWIKKENSSLPSDRSSPPASPKHRPTLRLVNSPSLSDHSRQNTKANYIVSEENSLPIYKIPKHISKAIKRGNVPRVLTQPLSPPLYADYFAALLYAEEHYLQKWSKFNMLDLELEFLNATIHTWWKRRKKDKRFVVFDIDSIRENRPFLLSRDIVFARPSGVEVQPFEGIVYRVVASTHVLVDFENAFQIQHRPGRRYDINFSLNRICFRRTHQALRATSEPSFPKLSYLFPDKLSVTSLLSKPGTPPYMAYALDSDQLRAVKDILRITRPPPYIIEGQLCVRSRNKERILSRTGEVVQEAISRIYQRSPEHHILICSPVNSTCDEMMINLKRVIPEYEMFRANAAFRGVNLVPTDILPYCPYDKSNKCFTCPSFDELREFRVILSTFVSSFRLHREGVAAGHFSHIFLVDASSSTEPEAMIALANFANKDTVVVITGSPTSSPYLVRSDVAREKGLSISYYGRLWKELSSSSEDSEDA